MECANLKNIYLNENNLLTVPELSHVRLSLEIIVLGKQAFVQSFKMKLKLGTLKLNTALLDASIN